MEWPIVNGIPVFLDKPIYWGELSEREMDDLVAQAESEGWRKAVEDKMEAANPGLYEYVTDNGRARWRALLPLDRESRVLDIGGGYGSLTIPLARVVGLVVAVDGVFQRTRFIKVRAEQEGLTNVQPINADFYYLPLAERQFDLVVLNGILEWVATSVEEGDPRDVQIEFLRKMSAMLRDGGHVYIGIENRVGLWILRGAKDHSGLPYTSLMPRRLADAYVRMRANREGFRTELSKASYRTYTYTRRGYVKLLNEAGFEDVRVYSTIPGYNSINHILPTDDTGPTQYYVDNLRIGAKKGTLKHAIVSASVRTGLFSALSSCFGIIARKAQP